MRTSIARLLSLLVLLVMPGSLFAFPEFLDNYRKDPFRRASVDGCNVCHNSPSGGDDRNPFGLAFEGAGQKFTAMLRAQFPDKFAYPISKIGDTVTVHFSDPDNKQVVIEAAGKKALVDVAARSVDGTAAAAPAGAAAAAPPAGTPAPRSAPAPARERSAEVPGDAFAHEGVFFGAHVVNLPNAKPIKKGGTDFFIGHRFTQAAFQHAAGDLFGFDSGALITFGVRAGITDWLSVQAARSNRYKTIEFTGAAQVARQSDRVPLSVQVRGGLEGQDNFQERHSPFLQFVATRNIADRVSILAAPTFAWKTRTALPFAYPPSLLYGDLKADYTASLGLGMGIRILPTVTVVGEWVPRLSGFEGELFHRPSVGFGIQKSTFRHTFEFVLASAEPMTTAQYAVRGTDTLKVGFNIYRRLR